MTYISATALTLESGRSTFIKHRLWAVSAGSFSAWFKGGSFRPILMDHLAQYPPPPTHTHTRARYLIKLVIMVSFMKSLTSPYLYSAAQQSLLAQVQLNKMLKAVFCVKGFGRNISSNGANSILAIPRYTETKH